MASRNTPSCNSYKDNIFWSWPMLHVAGGNTQEIIHTKIISANPDPCVRWQEDIPKWLSVQKQHLLILTYASGGRRIYLGVIHTSTTFTNPDQCVRWQAEIPQVVIHTKTTSTDPDPCVRWQAEIPLVVIHTKITYANLDPCVRWQANILSGSPYKHNICWSLPMGQVAGGYTQVIIRTKTTSTDLDPCVTWQTDIPKWLSVQRQHLLILTHASGGRRICPSDISYKDNICCVEA